MAAIATVSDYIAQAPPKARAVLKALRKAIKGAFLVINASGPFRANDYSTIQTCIDVGCHYIDIADGRDYVANVSRLDPDARRQNVFVCAGASTTPAITSALVSELQPHFKHIRSIKIALNAGNKNRAGVSTIATILSSTRLRVGRGTVSESAMF